MGGEGREGSKERGLAATEALWKFFDIEEKVNSVIV